ncbi:DUF6188 family protein [Cellulomonas terrae]|uniref:Uncharacterized protein n=1 Tax=Cellulomonas terrae TaxID=311234 RepID=A0A511JK00_9CELL|nr:DUF6188 family protein [Cellulomonas terrae]GEL98338.1 hypothetical protein CTE05_18850 [Cellulomonas terrae]
MYGLEVGTDVSGLKGRTIEQIAVGEHQAQLHLSNSASISIEGDFSMTSAGGAPTIFERPRDAAQALADRLGLDVVSADVLEPGVLTLEFSDGSQLRAYDSSDRYESYQIRIGDRLIVV